MTNKKLKRMKRGELLKLLIEAEKENQKLAEENEALKQKLADKTVAIENSGSIAEAALKLSGIFEAAQAAADRYLYNINSMYGNCDEETDETH